MQNPGEFLIKPVDQEKQAKTSSLLENPVELAAMHEYYKLREYYKLHEYYK